MRVALLTAGTRGDVQPFVAIGAALRARGHDVVVCAPADLCGFVRHAGLSAVPLPVSAQEVLNSDEGKRLLAGGHLGGFLRMLRNAVRGKEDAVTDALVAAADGADVLAAAPLCLGPAMMLAEARRVPLVPVYLQPVVPTSAFPSPVLDVGSLGPLNWWTHRLFETVFWRAGGDDTARFAARVGVAAPTENLVVAARNLPSLHTYSPVVVPKPSDWPASHRLTGMVGLSSSTRAAVGESAPPGLADFLDAGPPPVFFGFGSMPVLDPAAMLQVVDDVAADLGVRALVGAGWSAYDGAAAGRVFVAAAFDHDTWLPRCRAAVHHGGCGTTHAVLRAGLPAVVCSFLTDQPFWARQLVRLGVGAHVPFARLSRARLTAALLTVLDDAAAARARALAPVLRAEDGAAVAASAIEAAVGVSPRGRATPLPPP